MAVVMGSSGVNGLTFHDLLASWGFIGAGVGREVYI